MRVALRYEVRAILPAGREQSADVCWPATFLEIGGEMGSPKAERSPAKVKAADAPKRARKPSLRERQRSLTRSALLDGAREVFESKGYGDATIDEIAARAGTSRGTFYLYFSKGEALAELVTDAFFASLGASEDGLLGNLDRVSPLTTENLRAWIARYVHTWEENKLLGRAWMEGDVIDPEVRGLTEQRLRRAVGVLTTIITHARASAGLSVDQKDVRARATLMDLQLSYFAYHVVMRGLDVDVDAGIAIMAEQWHAAIYSGD